MAIANIPGISTLKMRAGYAVETTPGVAPVSYTHLDVYKRQGILCSVVGRSIVLRERKGPRGMAMGCESECVNIHRIESLENDFRDLKKKISQEHEKFYSRIEELERRMDVVSNDLQHIRDAVDEVNNNAKSLSLIHILFGFQGYVRCSPREYEE